jgi:hypothetical protein
MHTRYLIPILLLVTVSSPAQAQQVDCTVQVNFEAVAGSHRELLVDFQTHVSEYLNNYSWGPDNLDERVKCTMSIFIRGATGENSYSAQAFVGSQRPIFGSERSTAVLRLFDESWEFVYVKTQPLQHDPYTFNDLTSFLDFYMYLVIGFDYDTYEAMSGTRYFQKAADIASRGSSSGRRGWQQTKTSYSRLQLTEELLNPKFVPVRQASYSYHFNGLDSLSANQRRGQENILAALQSIANVRRTVDPRNILIRSFFETKYMEIAEVFLTYPDRSVYARITTIDPSHQTTYEEYRNKRR